MIAWLWVPALLAPMLMAVLLVLDLLERGVWLPESLDRGRAAQGRTEAEGRDRSSYAPGPPRGVEKRAE
ncbi:hypothetical protein GCM10023199_45410 [Actinomycetospora chibensis]